MNNDQKYCHAKKHYVDKKNFYSHPTSKDGLQDVCKECAKERTTNRRNKKKSENYIKAF